MVKIEDKNLIHTMNYQHEQLRKWCKRIEEIISANSDLAIIKKDISDFLSHIDEQKINCNVLRLCAKLGWKMFFEKTVLFS